MLWGAKNLYSYFLEEGGDQNSSDHWTQLAEILAETPTYPPPLWKFLTASFTSLSIACCIKIWPTCTVWKLRNYFDADEPWYFTQKKHWVMFCLPTPYIRISKSISTWYESSICINLLLSHPAWYNTNQQSSVTTCWEREIRNITFNFRMADCRVSHQKFLPIIFGTNMLTV